MDRREQDRVEGARLLRPVLRIAGASGRHGDRPGDKVCVAETPIGVASGKRERPE